MIAAVRVDDPGKLADTISAHLLVGIDESRICLEIVSRRSSASIASPASSKPKSTSSGSTAASSLA